MLEGFENLKKLLLCGFFHKVSSLYQINPTVEERGCSEYVPDVIYQKYIILFVKFSY